jgi:predicted flap endonuclease-1-like 5' DNA nuclease
MLRQHGWGLPVLSFLEDSVAWYVTQSLAVILATFALGLIVGWLWWGRAWRKVPFGESDAVRAVSDRYRAVIAQRDTQLRRLARQAEACAPSVTTAEDTAALAAIVPLPAAGAGSAQDASDGEAGSPTCEESQADGEDGSAVPDAANAEPGPALPDDLQRIEGVGPRIAAALDNAGLSTYQAVADADEEQLSAALREAGLSFAPSLATWSRQAQLLAVGDEDGLAALQADLTAGRSRRLAAVPEQDTIAEPVSDAPPAEPGSLSEVLATALAEALSDPDPDTPAKTAEADDHPEANEATHPADDGTRADDGARADNGARPGAPAAPEAANPTGDAGAEDDEDELERVEGIGPRIATALRKAGIHTYRQLADTDAPTLQAALAASGLRFTPSLPTWSRQAALLAEGDEAGFLALIRTLIPDREGGRPTS